MEGNISVGYGGTLGDRDGGRFGKAISHWMLWTMEGDQNAAKYFASRYQADEWQMQTHDLNQLKPF